MINISNPIISQEFFDGALWLPTSGLGKISNLPDGNVDIWKYSFALSRKPISIPTKKHDLKVELHFLDNIVAKSLLAKAGSYDKITQKKLNHMFLIALIGVNWYDIMFRFLCEMIRGKFQSEGFNLQVCYLLGIS